MKIKHTHRLAAARDRAFDRYGIRLNITVTALWKWNRENICGFCGEAIEDIEDASVDHIKPLADGGTQSWANVRLAHKSCNSEAGGVLHGSPPQRGNVPNAGARLRGRWRRYEDNLCGACGRIIESRADAYIAYIVPLEQGGADDRDNLHLLHTACAPSTE